MKKITVFLVISVFIGVLFANCTGEEIGNIQKNLLEFKCVDCKSQYRFDEEVRFEIVYTGKEKIGVKFGIKIKIGEKWMLLVEDIGSAVPDVDCVSKKEIFRKLEDNSYSGHSIWMFNRNQKRDVLWNKQVSLSLEKLEEYKSFITLDHEEGGLLPYDIKQGGRLKLFVYHGMPNLSIKDPQADLFEFDFIRPKE